MRPEGFQPVRQTNILDFGEFLLTNFWTKKGLVLTTAELRDATAVDTSLVVSDGDPGLKTPGAVGRAFSMS